jgi:hypothetical protein
MGNWKKQDKDRNLPSNGGVSMSHNIRELIVQYHAYYVVSPYYVLVEQKHGSPGTTKNRIQAGFNIDVYGLNDKADLSLPAREAYSIAYAELNKIADTVSSHVSGCLIEVTAFPSTVFLEARTSFRAQGDVLIQIAHAGDVDQPAGLPENQALEEIEKQLQALGISRR